MAALYYAVDPSHDVWLPRCPFHALTGWDCPACGGQRALHSLLHGRFGEALRSIAEAASSPNYYAFNPAFDL